MRIILSIVLSFRLICLVSVTSAWFTRKSFGSVGFYSKQSVRRSSYILASGLREPSKEQLEIVDALLHDRQKSLQIDSVAGSGKTTTVLHISNRLIKCSDQVLLLTYNSRLKEETRERKKRLNLRNLEVHSYHSFGFMYYGESCKTDIGLKQVIDGKLLMKQPIPAYAIIVVDEAQDMNKLFFNFVRKLLQDRHSANANAKSVQLVTIGDELQCIYEFKGADKRFLTMAHAIYTSDKTSLSSLASNWDTKYLRTSFRLTGNIARFVNEVLLGSQKIISSQPPGEKVDYYVGDQWKAACIIANDLVSQINRGELEPEDIFVLAPSISKHQKSKKDQSKKDPLPSSRRKKVGDSPLKTFENILAERDIPIYIPPGDDSQNFDDNLAAKKVLFSSFHQSKGLERKVVVIFEFSVNYFKYYAKDLDRFICPVYAASTIYVAATRALKKLIVVGESSRGEHLPFMKRSHLDRMSEEPDRPVEIIGQLFNNRTSNNNNETDEYSPSLDVTALLKFLPEDTLDNARALISWKQLHFNDKSEKLDTIKLKGVVDGAFTKSQLPQFVAELNGIAIPAMLECKLKGECTIYNELNRAGVMHRKVQLVFDRISKPPCSANSSSADYFLKLAAVYAAGRRGFISILTQLKRFNWIPSTDAQRCVDRLESAVLLDGLSEGTEVDKESTASIYHINNRVHVSDLSFELMLSTTLRPVETTFKYPVTFSGCVDIESPTIVWEIKCVGGDLETTHFLQLAIYAWLWNREQDDIGNLNRNIFDKKFRILNVLSGEAWEMDNSCMIPDQHGNSPLDVMMNILIKYHYRTKETMDDDAFLKSILINSTTTASSKTKKLKKHPRVTKMGPARKLKSTQKQTVVDLEPVYVDKYGISHSLQ